ncbi:unnamed protein product [Discosporangium mesarthrocarpum]
MPRPKRKIAETILPSETKEPPPAEDYSSSSYWEQRYRSGISWEWYFGYRELQPLFDRFVSKNARILDVGCGDKPLAWDLRADGYTGTICSFDFAPSVVSQLEAEKQACTERKSDSGVTFKVMDARDLKLDDKSFDLAVDKGTIDAMLCSDNGKENARSICREAGRVLAIGGIFMLVSHVRPSSDEGMELLSKTLLAGLQESTPASEARWSVDIHCGEEAEDEEEDKDGGGESGCETGEGGPCVYMMKKLPRRFTRSSLDGEGCNVPVRVHEY